MFLEFALFIFIRGSLGQDVTFTLGNLGEIRGVTTKAKEYPGAPFSGRDYFKFRNIPYAHPVINENRFKQSSIWNDTALIKDGVYDATKDGPLCIQGTTGPEDISALTSMPTTELVKELVCQIGLCSDDELFLTALLQIFELLLDLEPGMMQDKTVGKLLNDWLDIDLSMSEDCLQLSVTTPMKPNGEEQKLYPVMFFVHGGAFYAGTHIRMGADRLGAWDEVIVVGINYRVGPLGFICLDTEEAAGNMGMLDMVVALEWVHQYIGYFGGDNSRITIFGESAGSASINHLLLSPQTNGLFSQGIGQSGSALASWAFDNNPEYHAENIGLRVNCKIENHDELVKCMREVPPMNISKAFVDYRTSLRQNGDLGFGGSIPCAQSKGARKFYDASKGENPESLMFAGNYDHVPIMFGANSYEGSFVYGAVYNGFLEPNNLTEDKEFLTNGFVPQILQTVGVSNGYALEEMIRDEYFENWQLGNLTAMMPGAIDLFSVFFLKASSYKTVQENSKYKDSYWYSFEYKGIQKSIFHLLYILEDRKAGIVDPGTCHADELMYLFDVELPLILCNVGEMTPDILACIGDLETCVVPDSEFRKKWSHCLTGQLTEEELSVSATLAQIWTNFAVRGSPGFQLDPWTIDKPVYISIGLNTSIKEDYSQEYHVALRESLPDKQEEGGAGLMVVSNIYLVLYSVYLSFK